MLASGVLGIKPDDSGRRVAQTHDASQRSGVPIAPDNERDGAGRVDHANGLHQLGSECRFALGDRGARSRARGG